MSPAAARRPLLSGNWKMHMTHLEAIQAVQKLYFGLDRGNPERVEVSVHPPFTALRSVQTVIDADSMPIALGAQDVHWERAGAYTGEVSPPMLAKLQVRYVIVGHSERRKYFGETDEIVARKVAAVIEAGMTPIVCVGESLGERESGAAEDVVTAQVRAAFAGVAAEAVGAAVVAYEPLWAIGTGHTATADDAQTMCAAVRAVLGAEHGAAAAAGVRVQYGGSVKSTNIAELVRRPDVDGALIGGASLDPAEMSRIVAEAIGALGR